jgi:hypothetical protein
MLHRFTSRYSAVMSTVAVFAAMTGSAYALTVGSSQIANNSIRSVDIRTAEVMSSDIKNNDVKGSDIRNGTLTKNDFAPGVLTSGGGGPVPAGGDAATLGGVAKEGFQPAGVLLRGLGHTDAPSKEVVIDIPDLGIQIQTDGDIDHEHACSSRTPAA